MPRVPNVKWREQRHPSHNTRETWFARYRGWTLYADLLQLAGPPYREIWRVSLHRFRADGTADMPQCEQVYPTREGAQNAAEYYAEHGRFPHASERSSQSSALSGVAS